MHSMEDLKRLVEVFTDDSSCKWSSCCACLCSSSSSNNRLIHGLSYVERCLRKGSTDISSCFVCLWPCPFWLPCTALEARRKAVEQIKDSQEAWHSRVGCSSA
jgi:hypothetical protein